MNRNEIGREIITMSHSYTGKLFSLPAYSLHGINYPSCVIVWLYRVIIIKLSMFVTSSRARFAMKVLTELTNFDIASITTETLLSFFKKAYKIMDMKNNWYEDSCYRKLS